MTQRHCRLAHLPCHLPNQARSRPWRRDVERRCGGLELVQPVSVEAAAAPRTLEGGSRAASYFSSFFDALVAAVEEAGIEVLVTLELTEDAIARLDDAGLTDRLPNNVLEPSRFTSGGGIHSSLPLTALPSSEDRGFGRTPRAEIELTVPGPMVVEAVHPLPPIQDDWTQRWRSALLGLPDPDGGGRRLLAGDFNATHDHAPFRALLDRGWNDAADAVGRGLVPTFNALPWGEPVPPVTLDHVLVDGDTEVLDVRVLPLPGSDHRLLVVDIAVPAG